MSIHVVSLKDSVQIEGNDGLVKYGEEVIFSCTANGGPNNTYQWTVNGDPLVESDGLSITNDIQDSYSNSTLRIASVDRTTAGNYTCVVSNSGGKDSASIMVIGKSMEKSI